MASSGAVFVKALATAALVAIAGFSFQYSQLAHLRVYDPAKAYRRAPADGIAAGKALALSIQEDPEFRASDRDLANVRTALLGRPLAAMLLVVTGLRAEADGKLESADRAMALANRITRRDPINQIWLIERSVAKNDVEAAMSHYHAAMSVRPDLRAALLPVLASALSFPEVRAAIRPYISMQASWTPAMLEAAATASDIDDLVNLIRPVASSVSSKAYETANARIVNRLAVEGQGVAALDFASRVFPGLDRENFEPFSIGTASRDPRMGSLAWSLPQASAITSWTEANGSLRASVEPLARGTLASRDVIVEAAARYELTQRLSYDAGGAKAQLRWGGYCVRRDSVEQVWDQVMPATTAPTTFRSVIMVTQDCHLLRFTVSVSGPDSQFPSMLTISDLKLKKDLN